VYTGQILMVRKNLALVGTPGAVIQATVGMPASLTPYDFCTVPLWAWRCRTSPSKGSRSQASI
jgi:hypothetical protein